MPDIYVKGHLVQKFLSAHTDTHTHTHTIGPISTPAA